MSIPRHVHTITVAPPENLPVPTASPDMPASTNRRLSTEERAAVTTTTATTSSPPPPPATTTTPLRRRTMTPSFLLLVVRSSLCLVAFVVLLLPAFVVFLWHYLTCDRIVACYRRGGDDCDRRRRLRHLDIYGSRSSPSSSSSSSSSSDGGGGKPIVIFLTGGAWIIGRRTWGALFGRALVPFGMLVMVPDYGNFPNADVGGMVRDVDACVQWVFDRAGEYGGDPNGIVLVGQSAGAHVGSVVVTTKVMDWLRARRRGRDGETESTRPRRLESAYSPYHLRGFVSTSCPHNMVAMRRVFHRRGFDEDLQRRIFGGGHDDERDYDDDGEDVFERWSPYHLVMKCHAEYSSLLRTTGGEKSVGGLALVDVFPKLCVIHGTSDETVPVAEAIEFISLLAKLNMHTETRIYQGWSHTDPILEAPMCGDHTYHRDVYELVRLWTGGSSSSYSMGEIGVGGDQKLFDAPFDERHPMLRPICPSMLVEAARFCNPF